MSDGSDLDLGTLYTWVDYSGEPGDASNLTFGTNPAYGLADFLAVYPQFGSLSSATPPIYTGPVPKVVLQMFNNLANASLSQERWCDAWLYGMALFIAHFATLYLQSSSAPNGSPVQAIVQAGLAKGVAVSKSAGDLSESYDNIVKDISGWGAWKLTQFGQQLLTMGRLIGMGGVYVY